LDQIIHRLDNPSGDLEADLQLIGDIIQRMNYCAMHIINIMTDLGLRTLPDTFIIIIDGFDCMGRAVYLHDGTIFRTDFIDLVRRLIACIVRLEWIIYTARVELGLPGSYVANPYGDWVANTIIAAITICATYLWNRGIGGPPPNDCGG